ncbi:MAG: superoxide dismutase, Ni [Anaerolineales bacterium]
MIHQVLNKLDDKIQFERAKAHCDIPCGIYDPITAQIAALTVVRMMDLMKNLDESAGDKGLEFQNSLSRYIAVKEEHAEKAKHEIRVIWGDYIKEQHVADFPELNGLVHKIMQLGSKCRQSANRESGLQLVDAINQFAEIFWKTKNVAVKRANAPYAPALEMVYPDL